MTAKAAYADCSGPAGIRGALMFNDTHSVVQFCDGINWYALGGGAAPAGNNGSIQFRQGDNLAADPANLHWDNANKRLGIGTPTPAAELHIRPSVGETAASLFSYFQASNSLGALFIGSKFGSLWQGAHSGQTVIGIRDNDAADAFSIVSGGGNYTVDGIYDTMVLHARSTGLVGIGTANPGARLSVAGGVQLANDADNCPGASNVKLGTLKFLSNTLSVCNVSGWADLVTGTSGAYVEKAGDMMSGRLVNTGTLAASQSMATAVGNLGAFEARAAGSATTAGAAFIAFLRPSAIGVYLGIDTDNQLKIGGWSLGANAYRIWHENNDGASSGLDADLLDGMNADAAATASTVAARNANGDLLARYFTGQHVSMSHGAAARNTDTVFYSSPDNYIRKNTAAGFRTSLDVYSKTESNALALSDGDKGDVVVSSAGGSWLINASAVTYAKIQNVSAAGRLLGRGTIGAGVVQEIALGDGLTMTGTTLSVSGGGGGIPSGAIMAFDLSACPAGWSDYIPARGRFLRGVDNGAGNDPDGTRAPGSIQEDALQNITGTLGGITAGFHGHNASGAFVMQTASSTYRSALEGVNGTQATFSASRVARTANETRPKNVAVLYCRKD